MNRKKLFFIGIFGLIAFVLLYADLIDRKVIGNVFAQKTKDNVSKPYYSLEEFQNNNLEIRDDFIDTSKLKISYAKIYPNRLFVSRLAPTKILKDASEKLVELCNSKKNFQSTFEHHDYGKSEKILRFFNEENDVVLELFYTAKGNVFRCINPGLANFRHCKMNMRENKIFLETLLAQ